MRETLALELGSLVRGQSGTRPCSRSAWRVQFFNVSAEQPIFSAIEANAARESWSGSFRKRLAKRASPDPVCEPAGSGIDDSDPSGADQYDS